MLEVLQFYVSGFWVWLGITLGVAIMFGAIGQGIASIFGMFR